MRTAFTHSSFWKALALVALLVPFFCFCLADEEQEPVWHEPVVIQRDGDGTAVEVLPAEKGAELIRKQREKEAAANRKPDPGWIGDCYYYADGGYYHPDGVYWRPDMKTHYVYAEECWHLANGGILTGTGVYYPPMAAPDGVLGIPWRLAAVVTALIAGPPQDPGKPPERPAAGVVIEVRSSSGR